MRSVLQNITESGRWLGLIPLLCGVFVLVIALTAAPGGASAATVANHTMDGSGTDADPYVITTAEELQSIEDDLDAHYVLGNDIDATETSEWNDGDGWEPLGGEDRAFTGTLDGQGQTVSGLTIDRYGGDGSELTGLVANNNGRVTDLTIDEADIYSKDPRNHRFFQPGGILAGIHRGTVSGVTITDASIENTPVVGGVVGENDGGAISNVRLSNVSVTGETAGGVVGGQSTGEIQNVSAQQVQVDGAETYGAAGGVVGQTSGGDISGAFGSGTISAGTAGGIAGETENTALDTVGSIATVESGVRAGGIVGDPAETTITRSYAAGFVDAGQDSSSQAGGVAGRRDAADDEDVITATYWDREATNQSDPVPRRPVNAIGLSTAEMTGPDATENMTALGSEWVGTDEYPRLDWELTNSEQVVDTAVSLEALDAPATVTEGEAYTVTATIENTIDTSVDTVVRYESDEVQTASVTAEPGETTVEFERVAGVAETTTSHTVIVGEQSLNATTEINSTSELTVTNLDTPETVVVNEVFTATATVENTGGAGISGEVRFELDSMEIGTSEVELAPGEQTTVTATHRPQTAGDLLLRVASRDTEASITIRVEESTDTEQSSDDDGAGFGMLVGGIALLASSLLARRLSP